MARLRIVMSEQVKAQLAELQRQHTPRAEVLRSMLLRSRLLDELLSSDRPMEVVVDGVKIPNQAALEGMRRQQELSDHLLQEVERENAHLHRQLRGILDSYSLYAARHARCATALEVEADASFIDVAKEMLMADHVHSGVAAMVAGATLEAFLRTWAEDEAVVTKGMKPGMQTYAAALRKAGHIGSQEVKDITAWAGIRNSAAHGQWSKTQDRKKVRIMVDGISHFFETYGT